MPDRPKAPPEYERDGDLAVEERQRLKRPRKFHVIFHNDDYTTMEFVVYALEEFFHKNETEATQIMLEVHHKGYGIVGVYTRDIAESKVEQVMDAAKEHGHPLQVTAEPADDGEEA